MLERAKVTACKSRGGKHLGPCAPLMLAAAAPARCGACGAFARKRDHAWRWCTSAHGRVRRPAGSAGAALHCRSPSSAGGGARARAETRRPISGDDANVAKDALACVRRLVRARDGRKADGDSHVASPACNVVTRHVARRYGDLPDLQDTSPTGRFREVPFSLSLCL